MRIINKFNSIFFFTFEKKLFMIHGKYLLQLMLCVLVVSLLSCKDLINEPSVNPENFEIDRSEFCKIVPAENEIIYDVACTPYLVVKSDIDNLMIDIQDTGLKVHIDSVFLIDNINDTTLNNIKGTRIFSTKKDTIFFIPDSLLKNNHQYTFKVKLSYFIKNDQGWTKINYTSKYQVNEYYYKSFQIKSDKRYKPYLIHCNLENTSLIISNQDINILGEDQRIFGIINDRRWKRRLEMKVTIDTFKINDEDIPAEMSLIDSSTIKIIPKVPIEGNNKVEFSYSAELIDLNNYGRKLNFSKINKKETIELQTYSEIDNIFDTSQIVYQYPVKNQYHYLQKEYPRGFLKFKNPINPNVLNENEFIVKILDMNGDTALLPSVFNAEENLLSFNMPQNLQNEKIYQLLYLVNNHIANSEIELYKYYFRTSRYNSFQEKFDNISFPLSAIISNCWVTTSVLSFNGSQEFIDDAESEILLKGIWNIQDDIRFDSVEGYIYRVFNKYNIEYERDTSIYGAPPTKYSHFRNSEQFNRSLTDESISANSAPTLDEGQWYFNFSCLVIVRDDWRIVTDYVANRINPPYTEDEERFLTEPCPSLMINRTYPIDVSYTIPNGHVTSKVKCGIKM